MILVSKLMDAIVMALGRFLRIIPRWAMIAMAIIILVTLALLHTYMCVIDRLTA